MSQDVKTRLQVIDAKLAHAMSFTCAPELRDELDRILSLRAKFDNLKPSPECIRRE